MDSTDKPKKKKKIKKLVSLRHTVVTAICRVILWLPCRLMYGFRCKPIPKKDRRQYLIVYNHQTEYDQFFLNMLFKSRLYYVATEDMFSIGFIGRLLQYLFGPIPFKKSTTDVRAVMNCVKIAKQGGTICVSPEGNRTYHGRTVAVKSSIAALAKQLALPIAMVRIDGGYGVQPRWSNNIRRGRMTIYVHKVLEPEEFKDMPTEELADIIREGIWVDEARDDRIFKGRKLAEHIERVMYVCPDCGLSVFESRGNIVSCRRCGKKIRYNENTTLTGEGFEFPFRYSADWYDYQEKFIRSYDLSGDSGPDAKPMYEEKASLLEVIPYRHKKKLHSDATLRLFGDRLEIYGAPKHAGASDSKSAEEQTDADMAAVGEGKLILPYSEVTVMSCLGRNKLNIYHGGHIYQIKSDESFNAIKYMNIYYHAVSKGENTDAEFLGI